jgi:hypothetical protein
MHYPWKSALAHSPASSQHSSWSTSPHENSHDMLTAHHLGRGFLRLLYPVCQIGKLKKEVAKHRPSLSQEFLSAYQKSVRWLLFFILDIFMLYFTVVSGPFVVDG